MNETDYYALEPNERDDVRLAGLYGRAERGDRARELIAAYEGDVLKSSDVADRNAAVWGAYGNISMGEARYDDAVEEFTQARDLATGCAICFRTELAQAFLAAGQSDSAVSTYEEYLNTPMLHRDQIDNFNLWGVLIGLGEAYEATGDSEHAVENYNRFVDLWINADVALQPVVDDIKGRIVRLVGEG